MGIERRQGTVYQLSLLEWGEEAVRPGVPQRVQERRPCAPASLVKAEAELGRTRSSKGPRRLSGNEPCRKP